MSAIQKLAVEEVLTGCPKCDSAGGACAYCGLAACREDEIDGHPAEADWSPCTLCGGEGEVRPLVAEVWKRRQAERAAIAPEPVQVVDTDLPF